MDMVDSSSQLTLEHRSKNAAAILEAHKVLSALAQGRTVEFAFVSVYAIAWLMDRQMISKFGTGYAITRRGFEAVLGKGKPEPVN